jgi:GGDEF domain-containing protein
VEPARRALRYLLRASRTRVELERSKSRLARAQDLAGMGSFDWRAAGRSGVLDRRAARVRPRRRRSAGVPGASAHDPEDERKAFLEMVHGALERSTVLATDVHARLVDGRQRIVHLEAEPEFNEHGNLIGYTGIVQDVTDRRLAEDRIRHLANFDTLTGLPNRRQLIWRAERRLEHGRRLGHQVALLLIDLDRFKVINDTLGHGAGDELLMEVSRRLRSCVRHSDQVLESSLESVGVRSHRTLEAVGRLGGDEFVALLPEVASDEDAERVAGRILEAMRQPITIGLQECFVTASIGIAIHPRDGDTVADLMRNSDVAMYSVKAAGRNAASLYRPTLSGQGREKLELESALHKAIERNELVLHYQPKVDVRTAKMVGVEALMRWRRHGHLVPPGDFIPLAEETGLIIPISEWAIREAARQARIWQDNFGFADSIAGQPAEPAVRAHRPRRVHPQRGDDLRRAAPRDRARDHRDGPDEGPAERHPVAAPAERDRRRDLDRRLRHRLLVARLPDDAADQRAEDRPQLRPRSRHDAAELGRRHGIIALARSLGPARRRRGRREPAPDGGAAPPRLRHHAGLLFSKPQPPEDIELWLQQTVLPKKAPWIGQATGHEDLEPPRVGRPRSPRAKPLR